MASLPTVGGSLNTWGTELNNYLLVAHNADGTQKNPITDVLFVTLGAAQPDIPGTTFYQLPYSLVDADQSQSYSRGSDITAEDDGAGNLVLKTATGGDFGCALHALWKLTADVGSSIQRFAWVAIDGLSIAGPLTVSNGADAILPSIDGTTVDAVVIAQPYFAVPAGGTIVDAFWIQPLIGVAGDSTKWMGGSVSCWRMGPPS